MKSRLGEIHYNTFGSKMIVSEYINSMKVKVIFPKYNNWESGYTTYSNIKKGNVKCPYEPRYCNVGYLGEGYSMSVNGKHTGAYRSWRNMLERCYNPKTQSKYPAYKYCKVCEEWLNFQNFAEWYYENYYTITNERMHLDKDILVKGNKIYSPATCIFVPHRINSLFTKANNIRGEYPIGVDYSKVMGKFEAKYSSKDKVVRLGYFDTPEEAFYQYKIFKEKYIKDIADEYKNKIPIELYEAMYNYKVEIND